MSVVRGLGRLTLTQQWLLATFLAVLPLILAVSYATWSLAEQTQQHRRLLLSTSAIKDLEAAITQQIGGLERANLQFILLGDARFLDLYQERLSSLKEYEQQLRQALAESTELETLNQIVRQVNAVDNQTSVNDARQFWQAINMQRLQFSEHISKLTQESINASEVDYQNILQRLILIVALAIPGTVLLVVLSTVAVARPWWRLADTIRRLGEQNWHQPVVVEGPADFVELGQNLEWMRQQLIAIERQKQSFSQHVTHELKSPLAAIMEAESLLRDELPGPINPSQHKILDILRTNAANLSELIQQFLNYNTVLQNLSPEPEKININKIYQTICRQLTSTRSCQTIDWRWIGENPWVYSDTFCIQMILSNLLSNACKAVPDTGIVQITLASEETQWRLVVEDNGPGISPPERQKVFKPFYQGHQTRRGSLRGSGIGLSIVSECVEKLGGTIAIDDSELGGARISMVFNQALPTEVKYVEAGYSAG